MFGVTLFLLFFRVNISNKHFTFSLKFISVQVCRLSVKKIKVKNATKKQWESLVKFDKHILI